MTGRARRTEPAGRACLGSRNGAPGLSLRTVALGAFAGALQGNRSDDHQGRPASDLSALKANLKRLRVAARHLARAHPPALGGLAAWLTHALSMTDRERP